ncbi:MAG: hypothetical protein KGM95_02440 [Betaproteobacteria bacterium]|nr:hypothetical protein [Betaproteobacteria bacterium]
MASPAGRVEVEGEVELKLKLKLKQTPRPGGRLLRRAFFVSSTGRLFDLVRACREVRLKRG